ncbi:hypothetical protein HYU23_04775 [Candidatus Woesearchaeota archaeon]|nr:hypothetical protein [Candidatus Woesearchaeota archaeon]
MKTKCKLCKRTTQPCEIKLNKENLCKDCFDFLLSKYKTIEKVRKITGQYHGGKK